MKRNYIPRLVIEDVPASDSLEYVKRKVNRYRKHAPTFDNYLNELNEILDSNYAEVIGVLNGSYTRTNKIIGKNSIFNTLVKLYNYKFTALETYDYTNMCLFYLIKIIKSRFEVTNISVGKNKTLDFEIKVVFNDNEEYKDYWPLSIYFNVDKEFSTFSLKFESDDEQIEDGYVFFDGESKIYNKCNELIYFEYANIVKHSEELKSIINNGNKLSISSIQRECNVGFKIAKEIYDRLEGKILWQQQS